MTFDQVTWSPLMEAIGWALLHLTWQACLLSAILAISLAPQQSSNDRYAKCCGALIAVLVFFIATIIWTYDPSPRAQDGALAIANEAAGRTEAASWLSAPKTARLGVATVFDPAILRPFLPTGVTLWLTGVALLWFRLLLIWLKARQLVRSGLVEIGPEWQRSVDMLSQKLGLRCRVRVALTSLIDVPSVVGAIRPFVLFPVSLFTFLTPTEIELILAHELAHVRRHDYLVNILQALVETLLFYHPAVWWISGRLRIERENCCDDVVVALMGAPVRYARTLMRVEEMRGSPVSLSMAANGGSLLNRIRRLVSGREMPLRPVALAAPIFLLFSGAGAAVVSLAYVQAVPPEALGGGGPIRVEAFAARTITAASSSKMPAMAEVDRATKVSGKASPNAALGAPAGHSAAPSAAPPADIDRPQFGKAEAEALVKLTGAGAPVQYVTQMRAMFSDLSLAQIWRLRDHGVTPEGVQQIREIGIPVQSVNDAVGLFDHGVTPAYVTELRQLGLTIETAEAAVRLRDVGVTAEYVRQMASSGVDMSRTEDVRILRREGVTPAFVRNLSLQGLSGLSPEKLARLGALFQQMERHREPL